MRGAALATVSPEQAASVRRAIANGTWGFSAQYLVKDRTEREWVALRDALATQRISEQDEEEVFADSARQALAAVDAEAEIAIAKTNLDTRIAEVEIAWDLAASE
jgi:hypothetical protein